MDIFNFIPLLIWILAFPVPYSACVRLDPTEENPEDPECSVRDAAFTWVFGSLCWFAMGVFFSVQ